MYSFHSVQITIASAFLEQIKTSSEKFQLPEDTELYLSFVGLVNKPVQNLINGSNQGINLVCSDLNKYIKLGDQ